MMYAGTFVIAVVVAFVLAAVVVRVANLVLRRMVTAADVTAENRAALTARARQLGRALTILAYGIAALASVFLALARFGIGEPRWDPREAARWVELHGINIIIIAVGSYIVVRVAHLGIAQMQYRLDRHHPKTDLEWQRRAATIAGILTNTVSVAVAFVTILMLLRELSIDVMPILTGAGIAGLAIGFGAQNLVRDIISGFFLILEDQVRIGDSVRINGVAGSVEQINLRTIVLRDGEGAVQVFPNGTVTALANLSKQYAYAIVEVRVAYTENVERVTGTIREVGAAMQADAVFGQLVLAPIEILGVESIADGAATIRARFRSQPLSQGKVANELRRRVMTTFVSRGIRPYAG